MCTACTTNNKNVPEIEVTVEETETVETDEMVETDTEWIIPEETEVVEPEVIEEETIEAIDIVENTEEKPEGKKLNVHDAQKFLESNNAFETVKVSAKSTESEVEVTPAVETEVVENVEKEYIDYSEKYEGAYGYVPSEDGNTFSTVPVKCNDLSSNPTLLALQAEVNPIFDADGAISEAFTLSPSGASIAYAGKYYGSDCEVIVSENGFTTVSISCNLNDTSWRCLSTVMNELYNNGAALIEEVKKACYSGSEIYAVDREDTWVEYLGLHTKFVFDNYTLYFYFK